MTKQKTYNVTHLSPKQRQKLFTQSIKQEGFTAFIKKQNNKQTHYTFKYQN